MMMKQKLHIVNISVVQQIKLYQESVYIYCNSILAGIVKCQILKQIQWTSEIM